MKNSLSLITVLTLMLSGAPLVMSQTGSPSPNVPKESGLPSKEGETHKKGGPKGLSGQEPTNKDKDSISRQKEQMERKQSGK